MRFRTILLPLAVTLGVSLVPSTAFAAVPKRPANDAISCGDGSGHWAEIWTDRKHLAARNRCDQWLIIRLEYETPDRGNDITSVSVAPGAHFNVRLTKLEMPIGGTEYEGADLSYWSESCTGFLKNSKGKPSDLCQASV